MGGAAPRRQVDPIAAADMRGELSVDFHGEPAAGGADVQREAVVDREHQSAVVGRVRRGRVTSRASTPGLTMGPPAEKL